MSAVGIVATNAAQQPVGTSLSLQLTSVSIGDVIAVMVVSDTSSANTFAITDDAVHSYSQVCREVVNGRSAEIWYARSTVAGLVQIAALANAAARYAAVAVQLSDVDPIAPIDDSDTYQNTVQVGTQYTAQSTGFDVSSGSAILTAGTLNASGGTGGTGPGYTLIDGSAGSFPLRWFQSRIPSTALTDERPSWTNTTNRLGPGASAAFAFEVPPPPATAEVDVALEGITLVSAAGPTVSASGSIDLEGITTTATADSDTIATGSIDLDGITTTATADSDTIATGSIDLEGITLAVQTSAPAAGTVGMTLDGITLAAASLPPSDVYARDLFLDDRLFLGGGLFTLPGF